MAKEAAIEISAARLGYRSEKLIRSRTKQFSLFKYLIYLVKEKVYYCLTVKEH